MRVRNNQKIEFKFNEDLTQAHGQVHERVFPRQTSLPEMEKLNALFDYPRLDQALHHLLRG